MTHLTGDTKDEIAKSYSVENNYICCQYEVFSMPETISLPIAFANRLIENDWFYRIINEQVVRNKPQCALACSPPQTHILSNSTQLHAPICRVVDRFGLPDIELYGSLVQKQCNLIRINLDESWPGSMSRIRKS